MPAKLDTTPVFATTLRFACSSDQTGHGVKWDDIVGALGGIVTVANSKLTPWTSSVRVKEVRVYSPAEASSIRTQVAKITWGDQGNQNRDRVVDESMPYGVSVGNVLVARPPANSLATMWVDQSQTGATCFSVAMEQAGILEVDVAFVLSNSEVWPDQTITSGALASIGYLNFSSALTHLGRPGVM